MWRLALRRLALTLPTILAAATLVFALLHLVPGDPVDVMLGESAQAADREALRRALGLDRPVPLQYAAFLRGLATGDLGRSLVSGAPVTALLTARVPATAELTIAADAIAVAPLEKIEVPLTFAPLADGCAATYEGYLSASGELRSLPSGASLDEARGVFTWQPGAGFLGRYDLLFVRTACYGTRERQQVTVTIK